MKKKFKYITPSIKQKTLYLSVDMLISAIFAIPFSFITNKLFIYLLVSNLPNGFNYQEISIDFPFIISFIQIMAFIFTFFMFIGISSLFVGYTLGSKIYRIKLIDSEYNEIATHYKRVKRSIITIIDILFLLGLGSFSSVFDKEGRTMADRFAKTKIAYEKIEYKK